jgi:hypothetical protein
MTIAKVHAGQPFRMSAEAFNAFVDAATAYQASRQNRSGDGSGVAAMAGIVSVRNDSGTDQDRFAVLGLDDPLIAPSANERAFLERVLLSAVLPDQDQHAHRFCVLQEPIAAGALGRAMVLGVTPIRLDIQAADDEVAAVVSNQTGSLKTGSDGGARILWKDAGTGEQWGIVQFPAGGDGGGSPNLVLTVTASNHGWQLGDVLHWSGTAWELADAAVVGATDTLGVVGKIPDNDTALVVLWGILCLDGLDPHTDYWLDPAIPGGTTATKPTDNARLVLHHAESRLCVVKAGSSGEGGSATRFADLTDVDVTTTPPADQQATLWDAEAERWIPHDVVLADPVPANRILAGPTSGADAKPDFRSMVLEDLPELQPCSVIANATSGALPPTAFAALADDRALVRVGGVLQWLQISTALLADGTVTTAKLAEGSVTDAKIETLGWAKLTGVPTVFPPADHTHPLGGALGGTTANAVIVAGAVGSDQLADGAVSDAKVTSVAWTKLTGVPDLANPTVGGDLIGTAADAQIAPGAVGTAELADGAVTNDKLEQDFLTIGGVNYHLGDPVTGLLTNPMTGSGDLIVGGASGAASRLPANQGGTLQVVTSKTGQTTLTTLALDLCEDVTVAAPQDKQVLAYDAASGQWKNVAPPAAGAQNLCLVGRITAKSSGNIYGITLYPQYPSTAVAWVTTATQLQGDPAKTVPANTWTLACGNRRSTATGYGVTDYDFFIQVPVWV